MARVLSSYLTTRSLGADRALAVQALGRLRDDKVYARFSKRLRKERDDRVLVALEAAFAYRGNVTLTLDDGESVQGFVSSLDGGRVRLVVKGNGAAEPIAAERLSRVELSGRDAGIDPRWEAWQKRSEARA